MKLHTLLAMSALLAGCLAGDKKVYYMLGMNVDDNGYPVFNVPHEARAQSTPQFRVSPVVHQWTHYPHILAFVTHHSGRRKKQYEIVYGEYSSKTEDKKLGSLVGSDDVRSVSFDGQEEWGFKDMLKYKVPEMMSVMRLPFKISFRLSLEQAAIVLADLKQWKGLESSGYYRVHVISNPRQGLFSRQQFDLKMDGKYFRTSVMKNRDIPNVDVDLDQPWPNHLARKYQLLTVEGKDKYYTVVKPCLRCKLLGITLDPFIETPLLGHSPFDVVPKFYWFNQLPNEKQLSSNIPVQLHQSVAWQYLPIKLNLHVFRKLSEATYNNRFQGINVTLVDIPMVGMPVQRARETILLTLKDKDAAVGLSEQKVYKCKNSVYPPSFANVVKVERPRLGIITVSYVHVFDKFKLRGQPGYKPFKFSHIGGAMMSLYVWVKLPPLRYQYPKKASVFQFQIEKLGDPRKFYTNSFYFMDNQDFLYLNSVFNYGYKGERLMSTSVMQANLSFAISLPKYQYLRHQDNEGIPMPYYVNHNSNQVQQILRGQFEENQMVSFMDPDPQVRTVNQPNDATKLGFDSEQDEWENAEEPGDMLQNGQYQQSQGNLDWFETFPILQTSTDSSEANQ